MEATRLQVGLCPRAGGCEQRHGKTVTGSDSPRRMLCGCILRQARKPDAGQSPRRHEPAGLPDQEIVVSNVTAAPVSAVTPEGLLAHWQGHRRLTRRLIEAYPEDQLFVDTGA